ncbi:MAG: hypothetical protein LBF49_00900 [Puniceicoccales bacterium]|jgi:hypothetical protein|nr:hypothetical protein [Puniceicoccales bacterium]
MDSITQPISTLDGSEGMASLEQIVKNLQEAAKNTQESQTVTVEVNGRTCSITAVSKEEKKFKIIVEYAYTPLGSRICQRVAKFVYDKSNVGNNLKTMVDRIDEIDLENVQTKSDKITAFTIALEEYSSGGIDIADLPTLTPEINKTLDDMQIFVYRNDLSSDEMSTLRVALANFSRNEDVIRCPGHSSSINASDHDQYCYKIALQVEAIEILLDAKENGHVGLERNGPSEILGRGQYNIIQLAYTEKNKEGPIALKPCDLSKYEKSFEKTNNDSQSTKRFIGYRCGSHRRNKATSGVQDMFYALGQKLEITVPHVIVTVSAAEVNGVPCTAMEKLEGCTVWQAASGGKIKYDNDFICQETWMQLQDILTGQVDRHGHNAMYIQNEQVVAFDHEFSYPILSSRTFASMIPTAVSAIDGMESKSYCMPPVIDEDMFRLVESLELDKLENMYREYGLTSLEIDPAMARARALKEKVEELKQNGRVIKRDEWISSPLVKAHCNSKNFYALFHSD